MDPLPGSTLPPPTGGLNRGQKSSAPLDVMLEELQLPTNRGSRMFQERQKRVEHFTLEHAANGSNTGNFGRVNTDPPIRSRISYPPTESYTARTQTPPARRTRTAP